MIAEAKRIVSLFVSWVLVLFYYTLLWVFEKTFGAFALDGDADIL